MSEFKDVTAEVVRRLNQNIPTKDAGAGFPDRLAHVKTLRRMDGSTSVPLYNEATKTWISDLAPFPVGPISSVLWRPDNDTTDILSLHNNEDQPQVETLILEDAGRDPRLYAVSYPKDLLRVLSEEYLYRVPFLVYFRPQLAQSIEERFRGLSKERPGYYIGYKTLQNDPSQTVPEAKRADEEFYYPYGWDYLFLTFWRFLNYSTEPLYQKETSGLRHQIAASGKRLVLVIPMLSRDRLAADLTDPAKLLAVLRRISAYLGEKLNFSPDQRSLGRVALAAFSGGNIITRDILRNLTFHSSIREVYNFDAPHTEKFPLGKEWVDAAMKWTRVQEGAMVRVYTQNLYPNIQTITGKQPSDSDQLLKTADGLRSAALVSNAGWNSLAGGYLRTMPGVVKDKFKIPRTMNDPAQIGELFIKYLTQLGSLRYDLQHHWFAALMLKDALRRSGFK